MTENSRVYNLNKRTTGESAEHVQKFMASLDRKDFQSVYATLSAVQERAALHGTERQAFRDLSGHLKQPRDPRSTARPGHELPTNAHNFDNLLSRPAKVGNSAARSVDTVFDVAVTAFESLFAPKLTPQQIYEGEKSARRGEADAEQSIDLAPHTADLSGFTSERKRHPRGIQSSQKRTYRVNRTCGSKAARSAMMIAGALLGTEQAADVAKTIVTVTGKVDSGTDDTGILGLPIRPAL